MSTSPSDVSAMRTSVISTEALGSRGMRVLAAFIDGLIVGAAAVIVGLIAHSAVAYWILATLGSLVYSVSLLSRSGEHNGQTLGKQWLGLRVVSTSGAPIDFGIACKREVLGRFLPSFFTLGLYGIVDALWMLWDDRKQTLHDKIGGTYVFTAVADPAQAPQLTVPGPPVFGGAPAAAAPPPPPPPPPPAVE